MTQSDYSCQVFLVLFKDRRREDPPAVRRENGEVGVGDRTTLGGSGGVGGGSGGDSGIGHICIVIAQSGWTMASHTCGRMISPFGPTRS